MDQDLTAARWDEEYRKGRYSAEPPLPFVTVLFVRVNSTRTQIYYRHTVIETTALGGSPSDKDEGSKQGLAIHFYSRAELDALTTSWTR
jgi:hypothetical protein